jgi:membrane associated rhomboid family serine protease
LLPYGDEPRPEAKRFPFITIILILINIAVFIYQVSLGTDGAREFVFDWGFVPEEFWAGQDLLTIVTSMFLHGGLLHIASNMLFLGIFGPNVEDQLGRWTYLVFYLVGGLIAAIAYALAFTDMDVPLVGASGAVAAVLGGYILLFPRAMVRSLLIAGPFITAGRVAAIILIGFWFLIQLAQSVVSVLELAPQENVAFLAHVAGFVFGVIAVGAIREARNQQISHWDRAPERWWNRSFRNWVLLVLILAVGLVVVQVIAARENEVLAGTIQLGVLYLVALIAIIDGWLRLLGRDALLGSTQRLERIVALVQIFAGVALIGGVWMV